MIFKNFEGCPPFVVVVVGGVIFVFIYLFVKCNNNYGRYKLFYGEMKR